MVHLCVFCAVWWLRFSHWSLWLWAQTRVLSSWLCRVFVDCFEITLHSCLVRGVLEELIVLTPPIYSRMQNMLYLIEAFMIYCASNLYCLSMSIWKKVIILEWCQKLLSRVSHQPLFCILIAFLFATNFSIQSVFCSMPKDFNTPWM